MPRVRSPPLALHLIHLLTQLLHRGDGLVELLERQLPELGRPDVEVRGDV
jgi:hypothetical protein